MVAATAAVAVPAAASTEGLPVADVVGAAKLAMAALVVAAMVVAAMAVATGALQEEPMAAAVAKEEMMAAAKEEMMAAAKVVEPEEKEAAVQTT